MVAPSSLPTSLLDALLLAEGYITSWHAELCQMLQQHDYPRLTLAEIAHLCGYLSTSDLERAQQQLLAMRAALARAVETYTPIPANLDVLIIAERPIAALTAALTRLGVAVCYAAHLPDHPDLQAPDLILIAPARLSWCSAMPHSGMVALLPADIVRWSNAGTAPLGIHKLLESYVRQAREYHSLRAQTSGFATKSRAFRDVYQVSGW